MRIDNVLSVTVHRQLQVHSSAQGQGANGFHIRPLCVQIK